jgi:glycogen debranching enzyme
LTDKTNLNIIDIWYNALLIYSEFLRLTHKVKEAGKYITLAGKTKTSINKTFWDNELAYPTDVRNHD